MSGRMIFHMLLAALFLSGCAADTLDFTICYQDVSGLRKDDRVLFEDRHIGDVRDMQYTSDGHYLVDVSIQEGFTKELTENCSFYISSDPKERGRQSIQMVRTKEGGRPLQKNVVVAGATKYPVLYSQSRATFWDNLERLESQLNDLVESFKHLSESEQLKQLEKELDRLFEDLQYYSEEMKHKFKTEILPRIKERIEELRRKLKGLGREDDLEHVDKKVEDLVISL